jgi:PHP family Zn ribbon phosphoesterase
MRINLDLHLHSNYSPGVFNVSLEKIAFGMGLRGIDVVGTGDCLFPKWKDFLEENLIETAEGIFRLKNIAQSYYGLDKAIAKRARFILQTELIFTFAKKREKGRKRMDVVVLFPSFTTVDMAIELLSKWGVKNTTGRPFVLCKDPREVGEKIEELAELHPWVEIIPAHIMTPEGIFGSRNNINSLKEVFGGALQRIHAIETGLSADPKILSLIPELDSFTFISSSDAHSVGLNVIGRESTVIKIERMSYPEIISAIRENKVVNTIEFPPSEGKYFLTGHRGDRVGHQGKPCFYSPFLSPSSKICPICRKKLNVGVLERAFELQRLQGGKRKFGEPAENVKPFIHVVPLLEILKLKGYSEREYVAICKEFGNELKVWELDLDETERGLSVLDLNPGVIECILKIKQGDFCFNPPGYDGEFGKLKVGEQIDIFQIKEGPNFSEEQLNLF